MVNVLSIAVFVILYATTAQADPVTTAIAALNTFGATIGITSLGTMLARAVISTGLTALARAIKGQPETPDPPGITTQQTTTGGTRAQSFILGRYATSGHLAAPMYTYETDDDPNEWLVYILELSDLPISGYGQIIVGGNKLTFATDPRLNLANGNWLGATVTDPKYKDFLYCRLHDGRQTAADAYLVSKMASHADRPWDATKVLRGVAYAVITFKGRPKDEVYTGGMPSVKMEIDGAPLLDPRTGTIGYTQNPMVMVWNIYRGIQMAAPGEVYGYEVEAADILASQAYAAMNVCDQTITNSNGTTRKRYIAGIEIEVDKEPQDQIRKLLDACGGDVGDMGGEVALQAGPPPVSVFTFTDDDLVRESPETFTPFPTQDSIYNGVTAVYPDPDKLWEPREAVPLHNAAWEAEDGQRKVVRLQLDAVVVPQQVRQLMREAINDHRRFRNHVVCLPPDAQAVKLLDTVTWLSPRNGYTGNGKEFEVRRKSIETDTGNVVLQLRERNPADYNPNVFLDGVIPGVPVLRPVRPPLTGTGNTWTVAAVNAGGRPGIRVGWNPQLGADGVSIVVKPNLAQTQVVASVVATDVALGFRIISGSLKPLTAYRVECTILRGGQRTAPHVAVVTTMSLGFGRDDFESAVNDMLDDFSGFVDEVPQLIEDSVSVVRESVATTNSRVDGELAGLELDVQAARQLAIDNLVTAKSYTETKVSSETVARQLETGQLAARLDEITAAVTSNNLLVNPDFADGTTGWTGVTVASGKGTVTAAGAQQTPEVTFGVAELLQWRIEHTGPAATVRVAFLTAANAVIGSEFVTNLAATATMKVASGQHPPPDNTAKVRFRVVGTGLVIDNAAMSKIDQQIIARLQTLEVALATDEAALASYKTEVTTKFGEANTRITEEIAARSTAVGAVANRTTNLETSVGNHGTRISTAETAITNLDESIAQVQTLVESESGRRDVVRDGTFVAVSSFWNTGALAIQPWRVQPRLLASPTVAIRDMPALRALQLRATDLGGTYLNHIRQPVTPGEKLEVSFDYYWTATAQPEPGLQVGFFTAAGVQIGGNVPVRPLTRPARWNKRSETIDVPDTAVEVRIAAGVITAGTGAASYMTNVSGIRTGEGYASRATVETLSQTVTDDKKALADYKIEASTRFTTVETKAQSTADAIVNMYSKSEANQAMAGQINTYHADVVQPGLNARASATAVTLLTTRVKNTEDGLVAQGEKLDLLEVSSGRFSANGLFRVSVGATPTGATSRIAIAAAVSAAGVSASAGIYMDAMTATGKTRVLVIADQFAISTSAGGVVEYPFTFISGQGIRMDAETWIRNLSVDTLQIAGQAVTIPASARATATLNGGAGTDRQLLAVTMNRQGARTLLMASIQIQNNQSSGEPSWLEFQLKRNGVLLDRFHAETSPRTARNITIASMFVDTDTGTGSTTYTLHDVGLASFYAVQTRALIAMHVKR